jgi:small-conductance mechanosensitive channel
MFWLLHRATRVRLGVGASYLALYTYLLWHASLVPVHPVLPAFVEGSRVLGQVLEIVWWVFVARFLVTLGRTFLLFGNTPQERKFATDLLAGLVYVGALFAVIGFVFDLPVTGLLATSGVVAIVLGLALQSSLSDLFSGIALNIERPYRIGDWIALEGNLEGQVAEINWRATHVTTITRDNVVVPNSVVAKSRIINYSHPTRIHGVKFNVSLDDGTPPARGMEVIEQALINCANVLREPPPRVKASGFGDSSIDYSVRFFVSDYSRAVRVKSEALDQIYRHTSWAGVPLATPRQDIRMLPAKPAMAARRSQARDVIDRLALFEPLAETERTSLATLLARRDIAAGESVVVLAEVGESLFFIARGVFSVIRSTNGSGAEINRLGPGDFFGEFSLLTGEPRSATVTALTPATV